MNLTSLLKSYRKHLILYDIILSLISGAVFVYIGQFFNVIPHEGSDINLIVSTLIGIEAEFASIFIAALAIVAAFVDSKQLEKIRTQKWFPDIWKFLSVAACLFLFGIGLGLVTLYVGFNWLTTWLLTTSILLLFTEVYRCIRILYLLISEINANK